MMELTVYHGTDCVFEQIDLGKSINRRDFGVGFYTTTLAAQAESWARSKKIRNRYVQGIYTADEAIRRLRFSRANDQISFHTQQAVRCLRFTRRYQVEQ